MRYDERAHLFITEEDVDTISLLVVSAEDSNAHSPVKQMEWSSGENGMEMLRKFVFNIMEHTHASTLSYKTLDDTLYVFSVENDTWNTLVLETTLANNEQTREVLTKGEKK